MEILIVEGLYQGTVFQGGNDKEVHFVFDEKLDIVYLLPDIAGSIFDGYIYILVETGFRHDFLIHLFAPFSTRTLRKTDSNLFLLPCARNQASIQKSEQNPPDKIYLCHLGYDVF